MDDGPGPIGSEGNEEGQLGIPDDRVDWEKVEAIMIVIWYNMKNKGLDRLPVFQQFWGVPFAGCWPNSYVPLPLHRELKDIDLEDPYDVSGTWLRVSMLPKIGCISGRELTLGTHQRSSASSTLTISSPTTSHHMTAYPPTFRGPS